MASLNRLASNWSFVERERLNTNWSIIENYLSNLQGQINLLTGDVNVQELIDELNRLLNDGTIILSELETVLNNATEIITDAQNATENANDATQSALNAINDIQSMIDNFHSKGIYDTDTVYYKNNSVFHEGSSYIFINNTPGKGNPPPNYPTVVNDHWQMTAAKGASGDGAVSKVNGKEPDGTGEVILTASDVGAASAEQLEQMKPKVDNSWQKGVLNDTDITNLGQYTATRTYNVEYTDWQAPSSNFEMVSIFIPIGAFSGSVKVSIISDYNHTDAFGLFEYINSYFKRANGTLGTNSRTILKADSKVTNDFYFPDFNFSNTLFTIPIVRKPNAKNSLTIKVELMSNRNDTLIFNALNDSYIYFEDLGTSWSGYPWTPQTSSFVSKDVSGTLNREYTFTSQSPIIFAPLNQYHHIFHKSDDGALHIIPSVEINGGNWDFNKSFRLSPNGYGSIKGLIVDGVDLKQSVSDGKTKVASAITDKGVSTSPTATFDTMANNIRAIQTGVKQAEFNLQTTSVILDGASGTITTPAMNFQPMNASNTMLGTTVFRGTGGDISQSTVINGIAYIEKCTINNIGNGSYTVTFTIRNKTGSGISLPVGATLRTTITG